MSHSRGGAGDFSRQAQGLPAIVLSLSDVLLRSITSTCSLLRSLDRATCPAPTSSTAAGEARDDDVEDGNNSVDNGLEDGSDSVDDGHEGSTDGAEDGRDLKSWSERVHMEKCQTITYARDDGTHSGVLTCIYACLLCDVFVGALALM